MKMKYKSVKNLKKIKIVMQKDSQQKKLFLKHLVLAFQME